jgi:hypothetical protein
MMMVLAAVLFFSLSLYSQGGGFDVIALPVKLEYFNLQLTAPKKIELNWKTAEQFVTNISYELQRAADNYEFKTIGVLLPPDNSPTPTVYRFRDDFSNVNVKKVLFYRIKQTQNGKISFSDVKAFRLTNDASGIIIKTFPNPVTNYLQLNIYGDKKSKASVIATDLAGKTLLQKEVMVEEGSNTYNLPEVAGLIKGVFFLKVMMGGEVQKIEKLIKL